MTEGFDDWSDIDWSEVFPEKANKNNDKGAAPQPPPLPFFSPIGNGDAYGMAAFTEELGKLAMTGPETHNRNDTLNDVWFRLSSLAKGGHLDYTWAQQQVYDMARTVGLSDSETRKTMLSAERGSETKVGARHVELHDGIEPAFVIDEHGNPVDAPAALEGPKSALEDPWAAAAAARRAEAENAPEGATDGLAPGLAAWRQQQIELGIIKLDIAEHARQGYASIKAEELGQSRPRPIMLDEFLLTPDEDAKYRIKDLLPAGGRALLSAQYKAGKTSMIANLMRALVDGGSFLGGFPAEPVDRLTLIDDELDERMLRRWLRDQNIVHTERVQIISLKGLVSTFDILSDANRAMWAEDIRGSQFIILDCLRPCLDALGLSEDKDAGRFLVAWDALMKEAGATEAVVVQHMGHSGERSRGDSRLLDWPDVNWKIVKDSQAEGMDPTEIDADGGARWFSAHGRDVNVAEGQLEWRESDRSITYIPGGRKQKKTDELVQPVVEFVNGRILGAPRPVLQDHLIEVMGWPSSKANTAIKRALTGDFIIEKFMDNKKVYFINHDAEPTNFEV